MKKIILSFAVIFSILISSCSEETNYQYRTINKDVLDISLESLTVEEAFLETVRRIYDVPKLDDIARERVLYIFNGFQTGSIHKPIEDEISSSTSLYGIGKVTSPHAASALVQYMYMSAKDDETNPLYKALTYRNIMDNDTYQNEIITPIKNYDDTVYKTMIQDYRYIAQSGAKISEISSMYESMLLDSTSSASKTAGGSGTVVTDKYQVSANVAYFVSRLPYTAGQIFDYDSILVSKQIAKALYEFNDASKLKISYDKTLKSFSLDEVIVGINDTKSDVHKFMNKVISDISRSNGKPGGQPYRDEPDDEYRESSGYDKNSTDYSLYPKVTEKLFGAPDNVSNMAVNRTLEVYKKLKANGLRVPVKSTSDVGYNSLSEIISKHIRLNYYSYLDFQKDTYRFNSANIDGTQSIITKLFENIDGVTGTAPACALIHEFNKAVEDAERSKPEYNCAQFDVNASGVLCGIDVINKNTCN